MELYFCLRSSHHVLQINLSHICIQLCIQMALAHGHILIQLFIQLFPRRDLMAVEFGPAAPWIRPPDRHKTTTTCAQRIKVYSRGKVMNENICMYWIYCNCTTSVRWITTYFIQKKKEVFLRETYSFLVLRAVEQSKNYQEINLSATVEKKWNRAHMS